MEIRSLRIDFDNDVLEVPYDLFITKSKER